MKYFFSALLFVFAAQLFAQQKTNQTKHLPFETIYFAGIQFNNASNLNRVLKDYDSGKVPGFGWNAGAGLAYRIKQTLIGVNFSLSTSGKNDNKMNTGDFTLYVSTNAIRTGGLIFSPQLGVGTQSTTFTIQKKNLNGEFGDFLTTQSNQTKMKHDAAIVDLSVTLKTSNSERTSFRPECRIGYKSSITHNDWKVVNAAVSNVPKDRLGHFYVQLAWGIGR